ncbi:MAG: hypothetical protein ABIT01_13320 [Thermoanaerobaculia bacterium]
MSTDGTGERTRKRELSPAHYCYPDERNQRIKELEKTLRGVLFLCGQTFELREDSNVEEARLVLENGFHG